MLESKQKTNGTQYDPMSYTYNLSGTLIETKYPSGRIVKNEIDQIGRLKEVASKKDEDHGLWNYASNFVYSASGAASSMRLGNGRWESTNFNSRLQPTQIALGKTENATDLLKLDYEYDDGVNKDNNGNVMKQTIVVPDSPGQTDGFDAVQVYAYDALNRLTSAIENIDGNATASWKQTFTFDRYGNKNYNEANTTTLTTNCGSGNSLICQSDRNKENPEIDKNDNRIKELQPDGDSDKDWEYDAAGNTKKDPDGREFFYDGENKQIEVKDSLDQTIGKYFFDGDGKRVMKHIPSTGETTVFHYDAGGKLIAEYSTDVEPVSTAKVGYTLEDHLGSPRIVADRDGKIQSRRDFLPFGEEITSSHTSERSIYGGDDIRQRFTTYERDDETDLDFAQARMHNFNHGRFTSVDPIMMSKKRLADPQAINLYVYARNNPLRFVDPNGEEFKGTDGNAVIIEREDGRWVIKSDNASKDLQRLVGLVNNSGSSTANSQFNRLNAHKTMINFAFGDKDPQGIALGRHQPHGTRPDGTKGALKFENGKFEGTADIVKDANGNEVYAEATITIYEGEYSGTGQEVADKMVATFGHEAEHDLDPKQVQETKNKTYRNSVYHPENPDGTPVKGSPYWMSEQILKEIREHRKNEWIRLCSRGHICGY